MFALLLAIIYVSFISLGLPDGLLGSGWPSMYQNLNVPVSYAGIVSMIIAGGTIISSLYSGKAIKKLGTGKVTAVSVGMTAAALFGFSISHSFALLCVWAIPYGLGAGSVDAALNNFIALHYKARHMSWLHCFWGVGATLGPYVMGYCLTRGQGWNSGYRTVAIIQVALTAVLIFSLPLWKKIGSSSGAESIVFKSLGLRELIRLPGAKPALTAFFCYCALETTTGLWSSSYMVMVKGISADNAAKWTALFYLGITCGRFLSGFITMRLGDRNMVRLGQGIIVLGIAALLIPSANTLMLVGLVLVGLGCAPIYPSLLHETPENFGRELSQAIMGVQMACAYIGSTFMPPLFGLLAEHTSLRLYPFYLIIFIVLMFVTAESLNKINDAEKARARDLCREN